MKIKERKKIETRFRAMMNEMDSWKPGWRDIQRFILPTRGFFDQSTPNQGKKIDHKTILDGRPGRAARTLAAGMLAGLASPSRPWFRLGLSDPAMSALDSVKRWLEICQDQLNLIFSKSNIYEVLHTIYEELGGFGTGTATVLEDFKDVIRGRSFTAGEFALGQGADGRINSFARTYQMTVGQLVEQFGEKNVSPSVLNSFKSGKVDNWIKVNHLVEPNDDRIADKSDFFNMEYRCIYWENGSSEDTCLQITGFEEWPFLTPRWDTTTTAYIYGYGPGHNALGDSKQLQKMQQDKLIALDKLIDPPIQKDGTVQGEANTLPGGVTTSSLSAPNSGVRPAYQIAPDMEHIQQNIDMTAQSIDEEFFKPLFLMISQSDNERKTAYEVSKRYEEKLLLLGPVIERQEDEALEPLIVRSFNIALRAGVIPPPPPEIQGQELKIEYISILAQAQKMVATAAIEKVMAFVGSLAAANPDVYDNVDFDATVRDYADMNGIPQNIIRSEAMVQSLRKEKQKAAQQAQAAAALPTMVDGAKTLSETKIGQNSALDVLMGKQAA